MNLSPNFQTFKEAKVRILLYLLFKYFPWNGLKQCWGTVTFWSGSGSVPLTYGSGSDSFLHWFYGCKKKSYFFLLTCPQAHHVQSEKLTFFLKFCGKMLFSRHYFSPLNTFMREGRDPDPYLWLIDPDQRGPKTCGSNSGSGSPTLVEVLTWTTSIPLSWSSTPHTTDSTTSAI